MRVMANCRNQTLQTKHAKASRSPGRIPSSMGEKSLKPLNWFAQKLPEPSRSRYPLTCVNKYKSSLILYLLEIFGALRAPFEPLSGVAA